MGLYFVPHKIAAYSIKFIVNISSFDLFPIIIWNISNMERDSSNCFKILRLWNRTNPSEPLQEAQTTSQQNDWRRRVFDITKLEIACIIVATLTNYANYNRTKMQYIIIFETLWMSRHIFWYFSIFLIENYHRIHNRTFTKECHKLTRVNLFML